MKKEKSVLSYRQREGMMRNFGSMSVKKQKYYAPAVVLMAVIVRTIKGKLGFDLRANDGTFLFNSKAIFDALTANEGNFYTPEFAGMTTLETQLADFQTAINDLLLNKLGAEGAKNEAKKALKITLDAALAYVNNIAFLDQPNAVTIITGAKMHVIVPGSVNKQDFAVKQEDASGEVKLIALAEKFESKRVKAIYEWRYSVDNGVTWIALPSTTSAKTIVAGLEVDVKTLFQKRTITVKGGTSAWCPPIAITPV